MKTFEERMAEIRRETDEELDEIYRAGRFFGWANLFVGGVWTPAVFLFAWAMGWL